MADLPNELIVDLVTQMALYPTICVKTKKGWQTIGEWVDTEEGLTAVPRDDFHTMPELYEYRMLYNALLFNEWAKHETYPVVKSWHHSDGDLCFGGGWFIVVATLPTGQISNHYKELYWDLFQVPAVVLPPDYDGHTPEEVAKRLFSILTGE